MTFSETTSTWFDLLADHAGRVRYPALELLLEYAKRFPTKANALEAYKCAQLLRPKRLRKLVLEHIDAVIRGDFTREFRFRYHTYPKNAGQASACGELFSMIRQAIGYERASNLEPTKC